MRHSFSETYYCMVANEVAVVAGRYMELLRDTSPEEKMDVLLRFRSAMMQFECHMNRHYDLAGIKCASTIVWYFPGEGTFGKLQECIIEPQEGVKPCR